MLSLGLTLAFTFATAYVDYEVLMYSYIYDHKARFIQRALFFLVIASVSPLEAAGCSLLFYALFDITLNKLRGLDAIYIGDTAIIDKFFRTKPFLYICVKVICLFLGVYLTLI